MDRLEEVGIALPMANQQRRTSEPSGHAEDCRFPVYHLLDFFFFFLNLGYLVWIV